MHYTATQGEGFRGLVEGQQVQFRVHPGLTGLEAAEIRPPLDRQGSFPDAPAATTG